MFGVGRRRGWPPPHPRRRRVGADPANLSGTLRFWSRVSGSLVSPDMPLLWIGPVGASWIDVLAREPMPTQFFCLRAKPSALAMTYSAGGHEPTEELDADGAIKTATEGKAGGGRSWFARMMGH